jgi:hypothetical protein
MEIFETTENFLTNRNQKKTEIGLSSAGIIGMGHHSQQLSPFALS